MGSVLSSSMTALGDKKGTQCPDIIQEVEEMLRIRRIECMRVDFWRMSNVIDRTQMGRCARNMANAKDEGRYRHMAALVSVWICDLWFVRIGYATLTLGS